MIAPNSGAWTLLLALGVLAVCSGCTPQPKAAVVPVKLFVPPPIPPRLPDPVIEPPVLEHPGALPDLASLEVSQIFPAPTVPPFPPAAQPRRPKLAASEAPPSELGSQGGDISGTGIPPQLGELLPQSKQQALEHAIDGFLGNAFRRIAAVRKDRLSPDHRVVLSRVRILIRQAMEARKTDLQTARKLAERASMLAGALDE